MHAFDRQTDGQTSFSSLFRAGIPCSAEKIRLQKFQMPRSKCYELLISRWKSGILYILLLSFINFLKF